MVELGRRSAVTPAGRPATLSVTDPPKEPSRARVNGTSTDVQAGTWAGSGV
jgi:hypothetical protein